jgi:hypothetical protein
MKKSRAVIILGIVVAIIPFLGFPSGFKNFLSVSFGFIISILAYLSLKGHRHISPKSHGDTFSESFSKGEVEKQPLNHSSQTAGNSHETS